MGFGLAPGLSASGISRTGSRYSAVILGDTHYDVDPADVYHSFYDQPDERLNRIQRSEFARNGEMWKDRCPRLVKRASLLPDARTRFVLQMGDLIQGDCGNPEVHRKMLDDSVEMLKSYFPDLPFVTVVGNHDVRGTGADSAYKEYMMPKMSGELGKEIRKTTFSYDAGDDAFIVVDFNDPDDAEIEKLLDDTKGARHTFIVSHGPIIPTDTNSCRWFFHGWDTEYHTGARRHFRRLFAEREAICLCGHVHRTDFADWYGDGGRITQLTMNSVWSSEKAGTLQISHRGADEYGEARKQGAGKINNYVDETALFDEYRPGLRSYMRCPCAGSYKLNVSAGRVFVDFYPGDSVSPGMRFRLR